MAKKAVMGRPAKTGEKKDARIMLAVEESRKERYMRAAQADGLELSAWIRRALDKASEGPT